MHRLSHVRHVCAITTVEFNAEVEGIEKEE